ncbi:MAG: hypothetical protein JRC93_09025 [Deltaproteobacteria bacterium]|nr:hypothetical protein [Deltaproteobacteria bacterium]
MSVLGIRCSNKDFTYAVMTGSKKSPDVQYCALVAVPKNFSRPRLLYWMVQEIEELIEKHGTEKVVMKASEGPSRGKPYAERVELEAAVYIAGGKNGMSGIFKKVKSTIAKDLGLKGRGHYLQTELDTSVIPMFDSKSDKEKEAILAGWSEL